MKRLSFILGLTAVLGLTLASGAIQGHIRNRWGPSQSMLEAARKLQGVPQVFGGPQKNRWQMTSAEPMEPLAVAMLECAGHIHRVYQNRRTNEIVAVFVIVGPAGPISAHTPEICFDAQNYTRRDNRQQVAIASARSRTTTFRRFRSRPRTCRRTCSASITHGPREHTGPRRGTRDSGSSARRTSIRSRPPAKCRPGRT